MEENDVNSVLNRRRTISTPNGHHHSSPSSSVCSVTDDLASVKSAHSASYTSLKDLLPSSPSSSLLSPTPNLVATSAVSSAVGSPGEISIPIRNRLVKQAAWAYLQPAVSSSPSSPRRILLSGEFIRRVLSEFSKFVTDAATRVYDWLVDVVWLILCR